MRTGGGGCPHRPDGLRRVTDLPMFFGLVLCIALSAVVFAPAEEEMIFKMVAVVFFALLPALIYLQFVSDRIHSVWLSFAHRVKRRASHVWDPRSRPGREVGGVEMVLLDALAPGGRVASFSDSLEISRVWPPSEYRIVDPVAEAVGEDRVVETSMAPFSL